MYAVRNVMENSSGLCEMSPKSLFYPEIWFIWVLFILMEKSIKE